MKKIGTGYFVLNHYWFGQREPVSLVKVPCAAIPENLIECKRFGDERGAFTGDNSVHDAKV